MVDMVRRVKPVRQRALGVIALALLLCGPWVGWWPLLPLAVAVVLFRVADARVVHETHPEYALLAAWVASEVLIAASVALTGGPKSLAMAWFAIPIVILGAHFSLRVLTVGVTTTLGLLLAVAFGVNAHAVIQSPPLLMMPITVVIAVAILSTALMRSDVEHRGEAVIDELTGLLNRNALRSRTVELEQQSPFTGQPIGIVLGDLDHFKQVNDSHGHATGDAVLSDVAGLLRSQLRAFDSIYRIGGEEFLVLVPGAGLDRTLGLAERLRRAVETGTVAGGLRMTMSFGVSATRHDAAFVYKTMFAKADAALYEAKASGRNSVCAGSAPTLEPVA
jgi:diguanylate cyclase (GGDEF)-like protein